MMIPYPSLVTPNPNLWQNDTSFKQLIDMGEEVYTINIQLTSDYLNIAALRAVDSQPVAHDRSHAEPLPTDEAEIFGQSRP